MLYRWSLLWLVLIPTCRLSLICSTYTHYLSLDISFALLEQETPDRNISLSLQQRLIWQFNKSSLKPVYSLYLRIVIHESQWVWMSVRLCWWLCEAVMKMKNHDKITKGTTCPHTLKQLYDHSLITLSNLIFFALNPAFPAFLLQYPPPLRFFHCSLTTPEKSVGFFSLQLSHSLHLWLYCQHYNTAKPADKMQSVCICLFKTVRAEERGEGRCAEEIKLRSESHLTGENE